MSNAPPYGLDRRAEIGLGYTCNNRCCFCSEYYHRTSDIAEEARQQITTAAIKKKMIELRRKGVDHLTFLGGEPTIRKDFIELVDFARRCRFRTIFVTTNGRRFSDRTFMQEAFEAGLSRVNLSIHGPNAAVHDAATGSPGAFEDLAAALQNLQEAGHDFWATSVIHSHNADKLPELMRFLIDQHASRIHWAFVRPVGRAYEHFDEIVPTYRAIAPGLHDALTMAKRENRRVTVANVPLCHLGEFAAMADELYWNRQPIRRHVEKFVALHGEKRESGYAVTGGHYKLKAASCATCRFFLVCDGVPGEYVEHRGFSEQKPVLGTRVPSADELRDPELEQP